MTTLRSATTTPAPFPWPTLFLVRPGATPPGDYLGWVVSIPAPPTSRRIREGGGSTAPDGLSAAEALDRALEAVGFAGNFAGMGSPARIVAWGLVAPSSWERKVVDWVVARLGGQAEFLPNPAPPTALPAIADAARVLQDPLGLLGHRDPTRVAWIDGSDRDLEAHGVARFLRERLNRLPPDSWPRAWGDIRILLPDGRARRNAWESALTRAGIPVLDPPRQPLLDTGAARWLLRLLDLADWSRGPKERSLLQVVLDSPFLRFNGDARRADLRRALRGLRRHQVDLAGWVDHVEGYFANLDADAQRRDDDADGAEDRRKRCVALVDQSRKWAKALEGPEAKGYLNRVRDLVRQSWQGHTRPGHDSINLRATQQCLGLLDSLAHDREADAAVAGLSPQEALGRRLGSIRDGLAARTLGQDTTPRCGVHLATYLAWDGSPAAIQVLAGLEEGGYPAAPDRRSEDDEAWAKALGLPDPADELERQAAIAAAAAAVTRELLVVSSSRADEAGSETFPGPLLAAFEADNRTSRAPRVSPSPGGYRATQVGDAEVLAPAEVLMPADLTLAREARTSPEVSVALRDDLDRARHAAEHAAAVASARAPRAGVVPVGPYSGLVAADLSGRPMSATGLEALGQCGMKYFLGRVLGIEAESDSGVSLEPAEQGTLIHEAFADCVRETGTWDLRCPEDPGDRPAWLQAESQRLHEALKVESGKLARRNPSFSAGLLKALRHRWERTVDGWLSRLGKPGPVFDLQVAPNPERADPRLLTALVQGNDDARKALDNWQAKRDGLSPILAFLAATARTAHPTKKAAVEARKTVDKAGLIPAGKFDLIGNETDDVVRMRACDEIASEAPSIVEKARDKLAASLQKIIARDRKLLPLLAVAAETPIGTPESPCRIDLGDGLALGFRGRIDRVDRADPTRPAAVVDYKTGKAKGATALLKAVGAGLHLQLPLYAMALETVGLDGGPITVAQGALDHPRGGRAQLEVANDAPPALEPVSDDAGDGEQPRNEAADALTVRDAVRQHLRHAVGRLADGRLPLIPRSCPLHGSGNQACDFAVVCGHDPDVLGKVVEDDPQPSFAPLTKASRDPKDKTDLPFAWEAAAAVAVPPDARTGKDAEAAANRAIQDLSRDLVVEAGAGSGKTFQLVERYLAALRAGTSPGGILCITFTRKAATEMRVRIRRRVREISVENPDAARRWLRELGTAPILTFDAFARLLVTESRGEAPPMGAAVGAWVREWVEDRLASDAALKDPPPVLLRLLDALPPGPLAGSLADLLQSERRLDEVPASTPDELLAEWTDILAIIRRDLARDLAELLQTAARFRTPGVEEAPPAGKLLTWLDGLQSTLSAGGPEQALAALWDVWFRDPRGVKLEAPEQVKFLQVLKAWRQGWTGRGTWFEAFRKKAEAALKAEILARGEDPKTAPKPDPADGVRVMMRLLADEAEITSDALAMARAWVQSLRNDRRQRSGWTFDDVVAAALEVAGGRPLPPWARAARTPAQTPSDADLARRFPFRHVLVDEFQDTDGRQLDLIEALRATLERAGVLSRRFVVGDPKQSIYRFRGAEVDLFRREAEAAGPDGLVRLPRCHRAEPSLTRAFDRLFERLFDGRRISVLADPLAPETRLLPDLLDPDASVPWTPMAPKADTQVPAIELLAAVAVPDATVPVPAAASESSDDDGEDEEADATPAEAGADEEAPFQVDPLELALAEHIRRLRVEAPDASMAILTHSWKRALGYGAFLRHQGIPARVQGGHGLLETPEVAALTRWLETLDSSDDDLAWAGMLRGPTVGLSDPGLYCLRRGFGLKVQEPFGAGFQAARTTWALSSLRFGFAFDAQAAAQALAEVSRAPLTQPVIDALHRDQESMDGFQKAWAQATDAYGFLPVSRVVEGIVRDTRLEAILASRPDGLEALANLRRFQALLRSTEDGGTLLPREVLTRLADLLEAGEDPASAGVGSTDASQDVTVTVVHQAKGREWDIVIVPDLHRVDVKSQASGMGLLRFAPGFLAPGAPARVVAGSQVEAARDLFLGQSGLAARILGHASTALDRAESRRLLYVAMTRAKKRLVLSADWPAADATAGFAAASSGLEVGLRHASTWMADVIFALQLQGRTPGDVWEANRDFRWVEYAPADLTRADALTAGIATRLPEASEAIHRACATVEVPPLRIDRPSAAPPAGPCPAPNVRPVAEQVRAALAGTGLPATIEGTLVHRAFQEWGYLGDMSPDAIERALDAVPGTGNRDRQRQWLGGFLAAAIDTQPDLVRALGQAASDRRLHHEVRLVVTGADCRVVGAIDLLVRRIDGGWEVYDYKTDHPDPGHFAGGMGKFLSDHFNQVALYGRSLPGLQPPVPVTRVVLWRLKTGQLVGWEGGGLGNDATGDHASD